MRKNREEIFNQLREEFPEIFKNGIMHTNLISDALRKLEEQDAEFPVRYVLVEKVRNLTGRKMKLLKIFNQLNGHV